MKIKITKSPIFIIISILMVLDMGFAGIFEIPFLKINANMTLVVVIVSLLLFLNTIINTYVYNTLKPYRNYSNIFLIILALSIVAVTLYSYNKYGQTLFNYYTCFRTFLFFTLTTSLIFVFTRQGGYEYFLKFLLVITVIYLILCFINSFHYSLRGYLLWERLQFGLRNDRLRCQAPYSFIILMSYIFNKIFEEKLVKDKIKWIVLLILFYEFLSYICMTRMMSTAFYAFIAFSIVLIPKNSNVRKTILIIYAITAIVLIATGRLSLILAYIQRMDENLSDSTEARINSINYFKSLANANPFFSMGYVSPTNEYFASIYAGKSHSYFFDDVGIINIYLHYGLVGSIPFVIYVARIIYLVIKIYFFNKSPNRMFFIGVLVFTAVSQVSLCIFDGQRIMGAVILWALCEYEAYQSSPKNVRKRNKLIEIRRDNENHTIQLRMDKPRR